MVCFFLSQIMRDFLMKQELFTRLEEKAETCSAEATCSNRRCIGVWWIRVRWFSVRLCVVLLATMLVTPFKRCCKVALGYCPPCR